MRLIIFFLLLSMVSKAEEPRWVEEAITTACTSKDITLRYRALEKLDREGRRVSDVTLLRKLSGRLGVGEECESENYIRILIPKILKRSQTQDIVIKKNLAIALVEDHDPKVHEETAKALLSLLPTDEEVVSILSQAARDKSISAKIRNEILKMIYEIHEKSGENLNPNNFTIEANRYLLEASDADETRQNAVRVLAVRKPKDPKTIEAIVIRASPWSGKKGRDAWLPVIQKLEPNAVPLELAVRMSLHIPSQGEGSIEHALNDLMKASIAKHHEMSVKCLNDTSALNAF